jgi:hypothetical protein
MLHLDELGVRVLLVWMEEEMRLGSISSSIHSKTNDSVVELVET